MSSFDDFIQHDLDMTDPRGSLAKQDSWKAAPEWYAQVRERLDESFKMAGYEMLTNEQMALLDMLQEFWRERGFIHDKTFRRIVIMTWHMIKQFDSTIEQRAYPYLDLDDDAPVT